MVRRSLSFLLLGFLLVAVLGLVSRHYAPYSAYAARMDRFVEEAADSVEVIAVGNSHNMALVFEALGRRGYHLWLGGSDMFETAYLLRAVVPLAPRLETVFIPVSYPSFAYTHGGYAAGASARQRYYASTPTLRSFRPIRGDVKNLIRGKMRPLARPDHWKGVLERLWSDLRGRPAPPHPAPEEPGQVFGPNGYIGKDRTRTLSQQASRAGARGATARAHLRQSARIARAHPGLAEEVYQTLAALVDDLHRRGLRVVFYTPPFTKAYNEAYHREGRRQIAQMKARMDRLVAEHGAEYYDFSRDPAFVANDRYFVDEQHMSIYGARRFSQVLARAMSASAPHPRASLMGQDTSWASAFNSVKTRLGSRKSETRLGFAMSNVQRAMKNGNSGQDTSGL